MGRWITFDENTTAVLRSSLNLIPEIQPGDALESALNSAPSVALLRASQDEVFVLAIRTAHREQAEPTLAYTGFLGLGEAVAEEPEQPKKWWQKVWE